MRVYLNLKLRLNCLWTARNLVKCLVSKELLNLFLHLSLLYKPGKLPLAQANLNPWTTDMLGNHQVALMRNYQLVPLTYSPGCLQMANLLLLWLLDHGSLLFQEKNRRKIWKKKVVKERTKTLYK